MEQGTPETVTGDTSVMLSLIQLEILQPRMLAHKTRDPKFLERTLLTAVPTWCNHRKLQKCLSVANLDYNQELHGMMKHNGDLDGATSQVFF